jgi:presenilin-like A22 family membrane protease
MKHSKKITIILLVSFLIAQFLGIAIIHQYIDFDKSTAEETVFKQIPLVERPDVNEETFFLPVIIAILIGTGIFLLLIKYKKFWIMKIWFMSAIFLALFVALNAFRPEKMSIYIPLIIALSIALWRIIKPNFWIQNLSELFIYGGLAAIFAPLFNIFSGIILLILIALYDAYAVWKSKHMIKLAKSQAKSKMFAGLLIPYQIGRIKKSELAKVKKVKVRTAMLGGGDIGFPLIFAGIILKEMGLWQSLVIPFFAALGLGILFWKANEKKFYPAMPFISAGCLIGLGIVWLIGLV